MQKKVCGEFPKVCYKAFDCEDYAKQFMYRGTFRLNSLGYCRDMEDESRRDSTEGYGHTKEPGIVNEGWFSKDPADKTIWTKKQGHKESHIESGKAVFCFCTCLQDVNRDHMNDKFGKYIVKIDKPRKLAEDIYDYFIGKRQKFLIRGCVVVYNKGEKLNKKLTDNERLDLAYKQKPRGFSLDKEFRIVAIKYSEPCNRDGCKYIDGQFEQADPMCRFIRVNLGKQLVYLSFVSLK